MVTGRTDPELVTLADVAEAAGCSLAAASLALRGKRGVSDSTRERVLRTAHDLGYAPQEGLSRRRRTRMTLGLVIKAVQGDTPDANRFYAPVMTGIEESCRLHNINLMLATMPVDHHYRPISVPRLVTDRSCDGLVVVGAHLSQATAELLGAAPAAVLVDAYSEDHAFDSVVTDNFGGARAAVSYLVKAGHKEIAILGTEPGIYPSILQRRRGYEQTILDAGLMPNFIDTPYWAHEKAALEGVAWLTAHPEVTAVFCANDLVGVSLMQAAQRAGITVPERLSVVGFDDIDMATFVTPPLTTMAVDKVGMGWVAVTLLMHRLERGLGAVTQARSRAQLVVRGSVRRLSPG